MGSIHPLLSRSGENEPLWPQGLCVEGAGSALPGPQGLVTPTGGALGDPGSNPNDLLQQGWGVVAPEGPRGEALMDAIRSLIELRRREVGDVRIWRVPPSLSEVESLRWVERQFPDPETSPRYLLFLGDLHETPLALQQLLSTLRCLVGRLTFHEYSGYHAYSEKILRHELELAGPSGAALGRRLVFWAPASGDLAIRQGLTDLILPTHRALAGWFEGRDPLDPVLILSPQDLQGQADPACNSAFEPLLRAASHPRPTVLFTLAHGQAAPAGGWADPGQQRQSQGALKAGHEVLDLSYLGEGSFLPGGLWFMQGCFSAGTPDKSSYQALFRSLAAGDPSLASLPEELWRNSPGPASGAFVSATPAAALANPRGPIGFIGHVDLAWTASFREREDRGGRPLGRPEPFGRALKDLLLGRRVGVAFRHFAASQRDIACRRLFRPTTPRSSLDTWERLRFQDLKDFILLGDPAARLVAERPATR